jgi:hypothetical protein
MTVRVSLSDAHLLLMEDYKAKVRARRAAELARKERANASADMVQGPLPTEPVRYP